MTKRLLPVLGRRRVLQWIGSAAGASVVPRFWLGCSSSPSAQTQSYFSDGDAAVLDALADAVIPPDDAPGGSALGAVNYVSTLLTAFDHDPPLIYAGGPFDFTSFLPLDRFQTQAWKLRIYGSSGVPGGGPNDAITGPVVGLRDSVAAAIAAARGAMPSGVAVGDLTQAQKTVMLGAVDRATQATIVELVLEAAFSAPEYGGNPQQAGWKMVFFEGVAQPRGYSRFDTQAGKYVEDPAHPVSTPNPGPDPMPLDASTESYVASVIAALGGKVFP